MGLSINSYDIKIIQAITDNKSKKGLCKSKGTTVRQIQDKLDFSPSKIRASLRMFISLGWVEEGIKYVDTVRNLETNKEKIVAYKTYCITEEGVKALKEFTIPVKNVEKIENEEGEGYY